MNGKGDKEGDRGRGRKRKRMPERERETFRKRDSMYMEINDIKSDVLRKI